MNDKEIVILILHGRDKLSALKSVVGTIMILDTFLIHTIFEIKVSF